MGLRTSAEFIKRQDNNRNTLIKEGIEGVTKKDTMPNSAFPLVKEAEAMYFKKARDFLETTAAHVIFNRSTDLFGGK